MLTEIVLAEFHGSFTCNSDNLETTQMSINRRVLE